MNDILAQVRPAIISVRMSLIFLGRNQYGFVQERRKLHPIRNSTDSTGDRGGYWTSGHGYQYTGQVPHEQGQQYPVSMQVIDE